jgi:diaminohydroxyphosphoribosylaminopyrimidine deaminase/5-amino-6-(5-phosphoribosylamino)uracil reductase
VRAEDLGPPPVGEAWRQPLRVVVDPHLSTPLDARVVSSPGRTLIATCSDDEEQAEALSERGAEVVRFGGCGDAVNLPALLDLLGQMEVNEVLLETGATLGGAMLQAGLVDEMVLYVAPLLMGDEARGLFRLPGLQRLEDRLELDILDTRAVGRDLRVTARIRQ